MSNEVFDDLNAPKNLTLISYDSNGIVISFTAYNPESAFSGYNVYMHATSEQELRQAKNQHVFNFQVNTLVERNFIVISRQTSGYPSIQDSDLSSVTAARFAPTTITYTIKNSPNDQPLSGSYFIGVTAYSSSNFIESGLSEVIQSITQ